MFDEYLRFKKTRDATLQKIKRMIKSTLINEKIDFEPGKTRIPLMMPPISWQEINEILDSVLKAEFAMGRKVNRFENDYAAYIGTKNGIMLNSGSSANLIALSVLTNPRKSNRIKYGSEIICPAIGWSTTYFPIVQAGLIPNFVDIDLGTYTMNVDSMTDAISNKTRAVMPVHLAGNPCDMGSISDITKEKNLYLIEDTCEAHGSEYKGKKTGSFGDIGTFSFFISHHITTIEGGMLVTDDSEIADIARSLRAFGWIRDMKSKNEIAKKHKELDERFLFYNLGYNLRPTEISASIGIPQLKKIDVNIKKRKANAEYWLSKLKQFDDVLIMPKTTKKASHVWFGFPLTVKPNAPFTRNDIVNYLEKSRIETRPLMSGNMVDHPSAKLYKHKIHGQLKNAELVTKNSFFFGNFPQITGEMRKYVADTIFNFMSKHTKK